MALREMKRLQRHGLFLSSVAPARFKRRPTIMQSLEISVGRRGETPLVPPCRLRRPSNAMTLLRAGASVDSLTFLIAKCRPIHVAATRKLGKLG